MRTIKIRVYGRVQGVFFRANVKKFCDGAGLKGYVKNEEDGSVEIVAYGDDKTLGELKEWIKKSPGMSRVDKVEVEEGEGKFRGFGIKRGNFLADQKRAVSNFFRKI